MVGWSWLYLLRVLVLGVLRMFEEQVSWGDGSDGLRRMFKFRGAVIECIFANFWRKFQNSSNRSSF